jgi:MFS family permease
MPQLSLLRRSPDLRRLLTARLVSEAGTWLAYIALTVDVYRRTHSGVWIAALLLAEQAALLVVGFTLGPLADRCSRKMVLVVSDCLSGAVFAGLVLARSPLEIVGLAALAGAVGALYQPALGAALPNLVSADDLPVANALTQTVATGGLAVGPLAAGSLIAAFGPGGAYAFNAASFVLSALVLTRIAPGRLQRIRAEACGGHRGQLLDGLRLFAPGSELARLLVSWTFAGLAFAAVNVGEVVLVRSVFHGGAAGFGVFASAAGVGLVIGSVVSPRALARWDALAVYVGAIGIGAFGIAAAALSPSLAVATVCAVVGGLGNGVFLSARTLVVQRAVADELRGRAFAVLLAAGQATTVAGMALAGLAIDSVGARAVWLAAAVLFVLAAVPALRPARAPALTPEGVL